MAFFGDGYYFQLSFAYPCRLVIGPAVIINLFWVRKTVTLQPLRQRRLYTCVFVCAYVCVCVCVCVYNFLRIRGLCGLVRPPLSLTLYKAPNSYTKCYDRFAAAAV